VFYARNVKAVWIYYWLKVKTGHDFKQAYLAQQIKLNI